MNRSSASLPARTTRASSSPIPTASGTDNSRRRHALVLLHAHPQQVQRGQLLAGQASTLTRDNLPLGTGTWAHARLTSESGPARAGAVSSPVEPIYFPTTFRSASLILSCQPGPAS